MTTLNNVSNDNKVRAALHRDVRSICIECCHFLGLDVSKNAMDVIAELVYMKLAVYAADLEAFAKHAKRVQINTDDVKLLVRRNPTLKSLLNTVAASLVTNEKRRKTITNITKQPETPKPSESLEAPATKPKELDVPQASTSKDAVEHMVIDDAIDLTFDE